MAEKPFGSARPPQRAARLWILSPNEAIHVVTEALTELRKMSSTDTNWVQPWTSVLQVL